MRPRHLRALGILSERGPLSQQGLGEVLSLYPSNVVGLLNELEERGLVTRRRDCADRYRRFGLWLLAASIMECAVILRV